MYLTVRLKQAGGMHVYRLQRSGDLHTLIVTDRSSWRSRRWE